MARDLGGVGQGELAVREEFDSPSERVSQGSALLDRLAQASRG